MWDRQEKWMSSELWVGGGGGGGGRSKHILDIEVSEWQKHLIVLKSRACSADRFPLMTFLSPVGSYMRLSTTSSSSWPSLILFHVLSFGIKLCFVDVRTDIRCALLQPAPFGITWSFCSNCHNKVLYWRAWRRLRGIMKHVRVSEKEQIEGFGPKSG